MRVDIDGLRYETAGATLVRDVTLHAESGSLVGLVGPNGSGKSSLLRCVYRAVRPTAGTVRLDGEDMSGLSPREGARRLAALPQETGADFDFTVWEVVAMGRLPHQRSTGRANATDREACAYALARVGARHLEHRGFGSLSGGEKQRVLIARALAQRPRVLVLDEPTNHLDIAQQLEILALVRGWRAGRGSEEGEEGEESAVAAESPGTGEAQAPGARPTVLTALHDLNLAAVHCDRLHVVSGGTIVASGRPHDVLTTELLADVFGVRAHRVPHPVTGALQLLFDRLR